MKKQQCCNKQCTLQEVTLVIYWIWGSQSGGCEDFYLLGWKVCQERNLHKASSKENLTLDEIYGIISQ